MSFKEFKIVETIGKGSFASVYKVVRKSDNKIYALKRIKISKMSKKEISDALNEIRFLASIRHKNIVGFLQAFLESNESELCIIMEFCGCGDLSQKVERYKRKRQHIDEQVIWKYLIQCLKALQHLHDKGICHRDLKVANTFLAEDGSIKIGDMNVSKRLKQGQLQTQIGTPYYMSPEIWNNKPYDSTSDIWSLGCMFYELCALRPPFTADSFPALKRVITVGRYSPIPAKFSDGLQKIISHMLRLNAKDRPSANDFLKYPEIVSKLYLDDSVTSFASDAQNKGVLNLINTIKVPQNLNKLSSALPKACYPDVRPNSPTAWTVAEQKQLYAKKPPPLPPVSVGDILEIDPMPTSRDSNKYSFAIAENDNHNRRPLGPISNNSNQNRHVESSNISKHRQSPHDSISNSSSTPVVVPAPPTSQVPISSSRPNSNYKNMANNNYYGIANEKENQNVAAAPAGQRNAGYYGRYR